MKELLFLFLTGLWLGKTPKSIHIFSKYVSLLHLGMWFDNEDKNEIAFFLASSSVMGVSSSKLS